MKAFRTRGNEIPPGFWDEYETIPDSIRAKRMDEPFSLDGCEYEAGDYLGVGSTTYPKDGPIKYDLFAMPRSMFEDRFRRKLCQMDGIGHLEPFEMTMNVGGITQNEVDNATRRICDQMAAKDNEIFRLRAEMATQRENFIRLMMSGPCEKHSGENTPPLGEFMAMIKDRCFFCLIEENRDLRKAVIKERAVQSMMRVECIHAYDGVQPCENCLENAEKELVREKVIV